MACNGFGLWSSQPATVAVRVVPAWYDSVLVRLLVAAVLAAAVVLWIRRRSTASRRVQEALQRQVEERTRELYEASIRDSLLGTYNRRYVDEVATAHIEEARRHGDAICLAILDLDGFKRVNDRHGHLAGDAVLRAVATILQRSVRASDVLGRFGGDEFILVFTRTATEAIAERLQALVEAVASADFTADAPGISVTVTVGAVCHRFSPASEVSYDDLLKTADRTLYDAKETGKNRYVLVRI
jgi:diguanylate cyclase (GGDEF)-like protein